jgi:hypothetical protein
MAWGTSLALAAAKVVDDHEIARPMRCERKTACSPQIAPRDESAPPPESASKKAQVVRLSPFLGQKAADDPFTFPFMSIVSGRSAGSRADASFQIGQVLEKAQNSYSANFR